jgi:hypothetical protein
VCRWSDTTRSRLCALGPVSIGRAASSTAPSWCPVRGPFGGRTSSAREGAGAVSGPVGRAGRSAEPRRCLVDAVWAVRWRPSYRAMKRLGPSLTCACRTVSDAHEAKGPAAGIARRVWRENPARQPLAGPVARWCRSEINRANTVPSGRASGKSVSTAKSLVGDVVTVMCSGGPETCTGVAWAHSDSGHVSRPSSMSVTRAAIGLRSLRVRVT